MTHKEYVQIVKSMGIEALKTSLLKGVVKQLPFLASGPMNWLTVKVVSWLAEKAAEQAEMMIFFQYIDMRSDSQAKDFEAAMIENHKAQTMGTPEDKKNAEEKLKAALIKLVSLRS